MKRFKKSLSVVIMVLLVVYAFIQYPTAREPMLQIIAIIVIAKIIIWLLKGKDKKEKKHPEIYDKIPTEAIFVAVVVASIVVVKFVAPTLTPISLGVGIILAIFLCYRITKKVNKSIEEDDKDNTIDFKDAKNRSGR